MSLKSTQNAALLSTQDDDDDDDADADAEEVQGKVCNCAKEVLMAVSPSSLSSNTLLQCRNLQIILSSCNFATLWLTTCHGILIRKGTRLLQITLTSLTTVVYHTHLLFSQLGFQYPQTGIVATPRWVQQL